MPSEAVGEQGAACRTGHRGVLAGRWVSLAKQEIWLLGQMQAQLGPRQSRRGAMDRPPMGTRPCWPGSRALFVVQELVFDLLVLRVQLVQQAPDFHVQRRHGLDHRLRLRRRVRSIQLGELR